MRKVFTLGFGLAAATALLGLIDPRFFVLTAYVALIFGPVMLVLLVHNFIHSPKEPPCKHVDANGDCEGWPPALYERKNDNNNKPVM